MRRFPRQARARQTVEIIFEATARILERNGRAALSTNAIAERAGISIGTLYHYFQSKEAILVAMARREMESHRQAMAKAISEPRHGAAEPSVRAAVKALVAASGARMKARRIATETLIAQDLGHELARPVEEIARLLAASGNRFFPERTSPLSPASLFVLTRAVSGVVNAMVREESPFSGTRELEDALVDLISGFVDVAA